MPNVRIKGWRSEDAAPTLPESLTKVFYDATDMDADQVSAALRRLKKGRSVDVPFDTGDDDAAGRMMKKLAALGVKSELCSDIRRIDGERFPSWFIKYIVGGLLFLFLLISVCRLSGDRLPARNTIGMVIAVMTVLFLFSIPIVYRFHRDSLMTDEARDEWYLRDARQGLWIQAGLFVLGTVIRGPWLGLLLLAIGLGAVACAALVRMMTRRAERRLEVLGRFDPNDKAGGRPEGGERA